MSSLNIQTLNEYLQPAIGVYDGSSISFSQITVAEFYLPIHLQNYGNVSFVGVQVYAGQNGIIAENGQGLLSIDSATIIVCIYSTLIYF